MTRDPATSPLVLDTVGKIFRRKTGEVVKALDGVSFSARRGALTVLVGPDGAGKTTALRLAAGLMTADAGTVETVGIDAARRPQAVQDRIGYMPQRFGLYEDLSVQDNLDLYADLGGVLPKQRPARYARLFEMTALAPFRSRLAGRLSGGMKQKLGLACTLVRTPELLLLDEPTVGVDPLSRRELWEIVLRLVRSEGHTVVASTSYLDEAERSDHAVVLYQGRVLAEGTPAEITAAAPPVSYLLRPGPGQTARDLQAFWLGNPAVIDAVPEAGQVRLVTAEPPSRWGEGRDPVETRPRLEDGFMALLQTKAPRTAPPTAAKVTQAARAGEVAVMVHDLVKRFGDFTAVDHVSFEVRRGEIFGLLGPNGAGKTTSFSMLCGLSAASGGMLRVAGEDLATARASARQHIGYVAQRFSLYGQLTVAENLDFFARAYGLWGRRLKARLEAVTSEFDLGSMARLPAEQLPGGYKQRLAMAAALLHEPDILFLDEATSGADPLARREFWLRINALAKRGVTVVVTTHFMEEAEYCDRAVIMDAGRVLAEGSPTQLRARGGSAAKSAPTMEDAFISIVQRTRAARDGSGVAAA